MSLDVHDVVESYVIVAAAAVVVAAAAVVVAAAAVVVVAVAAVVKLRGSRRMSGCCMEVECVHQVLFDLG